MSLDTHALDELRREARHLAGDQEIPILDLGPYLAGERGALDILAAEVRRAQQDIGFYFTVNHGVPMETVHAAYAAMERFFASPTEDKLALRIDRATSSGYVPPKSTVYVTSPLNRNTKKDLNEVLIVCNERAPDHPARRAGERFVGPNKWPSNVPGFREALSACHRAQVRLGYAMLPVYARALGLPADYFKPFFDDPTWITRNAHYPAVPDAEDNQFGIAPHQDHGFITILPLSEVPGLEVKTPDGRWITANVVPDSVIINTGEFLNRWSNGVLPASPHRVMPPSRDRYSIALFFNPNYDTVSTPLPGCVGPGNPAKFEPMRFVDYLGWYMDQNFKQGAGGVQGENAAA